MISPALCCFAEGAARVRAPGSDRNFRLSALMCVLRQCSLDLGARFGERKVFVVFSHAWHGTCSIQPLLHMHSPALLSFYATGHRYNVFRNTLRGRVAVLLESSFHLVPYPGKIQEPFGLGLFSCVAAACTTHSLGCRVLVSCSVPRGLAKTFLTAFPCSR